MEIALKRTSLRPEDAANPLPRLLQTPSGLALLELQGTINLPESHEEHTTASTDKHGIAAAQETPIGRLIFPDYDPQDPGSKAWMKQVYMYVGKHQRLTGEVKKLPKAIAVIRKSAESTHQKTGDAMEGVEGEQTDELEIVEIVKYKILFSTRPEPVGTWAAVN
jgi:chromosome transmission fidelity protein 8